MPARTRRSISIGLPLEIWPWLRMLTVSAMVALAVTCWTMPQIGLPILWGLVVPLLPVVWVAAPGLWRNVCPMASVNQIPRLARLTAGRQLPGWLESYGFVIGMTTFVVVVALRPSVLEHDGRGAAVMLLGALVAAFVGGSIFRGKSGFCGSVCPLRPTQATYSRAPTAVVGHAHCRPCVGCTPNCDDLLPGRSLVTELLTTGPRGQARWVFTGMLPGITIAFGTLGSGTAWLPSLLTLLGGGLVTFGVLAAAEAFTRLGRPRLTAIWGTIALVVFLVGSLPRTANAMETLWNFDVGPAALWEARGIAVLFAGAWFGRALLRIAEQEAATRRLERRAAARPAVTPAAKPKMADDIAPPAAASGHDATLRPISVVAPLNVTYTGAPTSPPIVAGNPPVAIPDRRGPGRGDRPPSIVFWPSGTIVAVTEETRTVATAARSVGLPVPKGCGTGLCGCDPVYVRSGTDGLAPAGAQELATLDRLGLPANARLACSAVITGDVAVSLEPVDLTDDEPFVVPEVVPAAATVIEEVAALAPVASERRRVVIVGNGVAGVTAAGQLRRLDPDCSIDLITRSPHPFYNRIAIARLIHEPQGLSSLQLMPDRWYSDRKVTQWINTSVAGIDRKAQEVVLGTGQVLPYDALILATGARWAAPAMPGLELAGAFGLREAADAMHIRAYAQRRRATKAAVLGGGLLGLEVAEALHKLGLDVTVLERGKGLSRHVLDPRGSEVLTKAVRDSGITVRTAATVEQIEGDERVRGVRLADGEVLPADLVVCCVGIQPHAELAADAGITVGRGIVVDDHLRTSDPHVFACGDAAEFDGRIGGHWAPAASQAEVVAVNALGGDRTYQAAPVPTVLKLDALEVVSVGDLCGGPGTRKVIAPTSDDQRHQAIFFRGDRPIGLVGINAGPEIDPYVDAITRGVSADEQLAAATESTLRRAS